MKYKITLNDSIELLVVADSEVEAIKKAKEVRSKLDSNYNISDSINKHMDWFNAFAKESYAKSYTLKEDEGGNVSGEFGTNKWGDGVPVMKNWDRHINTTRRNTSLKPGDQVIIEGNKWVWVQLDDGWLCVPKNRVL